MRVLHMCIGAIALALSGDIQARVAPALDLLSPLTPGTSSWAQAINNSGQIAGGYGLGYRYTDGVGWENLGGFNHYSLVARAINDSGDVAGFATNFSTVGFRTNPGGSPSQIGQVPGLTRVYGINNARLVTGYGTLTASVTVGFTYSADGTATTISGDGVIPLALNNSGFVTGYASVSGLDRAFLFGPDGSMSYLPTPVGSNRSYGRAINDFGQVAGDSLNNGLSPTGSFVWSASAGLQQLAVPSGFVLADAHAMGINNLGWIVGSLADTAFLWRPGQTPIDLTAYVRSVIGRNDILIRTAWDVNDLGQIVGEAEVVGNSTIRPAYRLTIPSPSSTPVLALFACVAARRRRSWHAIAVPRRD